MITVNMDETEKLSTTGSTNLVPESDFICQRLVLLTVEMFEVEPHVVHGPISKVWLRFRGQPPMSYIILRETLYVGISLIRRDLVTNKSKENYCRTLSRLCTTSFPIDCPSAATRGYYASDATTSTKSRIVQVVARYVPLRKLFTVRTSFHDTAGAGAASSSANGLASPSAPVLCSITLTLSPLPAPAALP